MSAFAYSRRKAFRPKAANTNKAKTRRRAPPSSVLINAVLEHADLRDDMGGGRVMLRLSAAVPIESPSAGPAITRMPACPTITSAA